MLARLFFDVQTCGLYSSQRQRLSLGQQYSRLSVLLGVSSAQLTNFLGSNGLAPLFPKAQEMIQHLVAAIGEEADAGRAVGLSCVDSLLHIQSPNLSQESDHANKSRG